MKPLIPVLLVLGALPNPAALGQKGPAPVRADIPPGGNLKPRMEQPVFAVATKQGMRILVSRDDGKSWRQTFLGTEEREDGGFHGTFAVYGMAYTKGVIGVFSGWGQPGVYIGSDDGENWAHLSAAATNLGSVWGAAGGGGVMITSADQWRGISVGRGDFSAWEKISVGKLLGGGKTHHMISGYGDYNGGRFVVVGDNRQVFYSEGLGENWKHTAIPEEAAGPQNSVAFGNGVFLCDFETHVARSTDGGATWTAHPHGLGSKAAWRGLSFVKGEFWLTARGGKSGRRSRDGVAWEDLPSGTPGGMFVESETGALVNVERGRYDIRRSADGKAWETVFKAPAEDPTWSFALAVHGKVNAR